MGSADRWKRPKAAWRDDAKFCAVAQRNWKQDYTLANAGGYDHGAAQRLTYRYQGWKAK